MAITAADVAKLRAQTGAGMLDCKKALEETNGNFEAAVDALRQRGAAKAAKRADKVAAEGVVTSYIHGAGRIGVMVEINSETDFVSQGTCRVSNRCASENCRGEDVTSIAEALSFIPQ